VLGLGVAIAFLKKGTGVVFGPDRHGGQVPFLAQFIGWKTTPVPFFGSVALGVGLVLGVTVLIVGATRAHAVLLYAHVITSTVGGALLAAHLWRRVSGDAPGRVAWTARVSLAVVVVA